MGETDGKEPARYWGDTSLSAAEVETVRAGISARFDGETRDELLGMLLGGVQVRETTEDEMDPVQGDTTPAENLETFVKPKRGASVAPSASGRTKAQLADIRAWAIENGVRHTVTGRMPRATIEAYDAAHAEASPEARADEAPTPPTPKPRRKLAPMKPAKQPPALKEPGENELAQVVRVLAENPQDAHPVVVDLSSGAVEVVDKETGLTDTERWKRDALVEIDAVQFRYDTTLIRAEKAEAALDLALRKWARERERATARKALILDLSAQVIGAEIERRADAELLAGMDAALRDAQATIDDLTRQLTLARAAAVTPWWKRIAS